MFNTYERENNQNCSNIYYFLMVEIINILHKVMGNHGIMRQFEWRKDFSQSNLSLRFITWPLTIAEFVFLSKM